MHTRRGFFTALLGLPAVAAAKAEAAPAIRPVRAAEYKARLRAMSQRLFDIAYDRVVKQGRPKDDELTKAVMQVRNEDADLMYQIRSTTEPDLTERAHYQRRLREWRDVFGTGMGK